MATLFDSGPGSVAVLGSEGGMGLPIAIGGVSGSWYGQFNSILTELEVALVGNFQFLHTLSNVIYVYAFGDRISQLRVGGLAFSQGGCYSAGASGIEALLALYAQNKIAAQPDPITLQIGTGSAGRFQGYMVGLRTSLVKPEARISSWSLLFSVFPGDN